MIAHIAGALIVFLAGATVAAAQDTSTAERNTLSVTILDHDLPPSDMRPPPPAPQPAPPSGDWKGPVLLSLHAATVATQMLDVHSTITGIRHGGVEANPVMGGVVNDRVAYIALKAGISAGVIVATHKLGKEHKLAAIITSAAINSALLMVAQHNYKVARSLQ